MIDMHVHMIVCTHVRIHVYTANSIYTTVLSHLSLSHTHTLQNYRKGLH